MVKPFDMITILGPTASGKTQLAVHIAHRLQGEIISADSRQVYSRMDVGTGKDLGDYFIEGKEIPHHLINICEPGYKYSVYEYQRDFSNAFSLVKQNNKIPILCGGSGMYIESVLKDYKMVQVPINNTLRNELENKSDEQLIQLLTSYKKLHNTSDITQRKRLIRAIEIEEYEKYLSQNAKHNNHKTDNLDNKSQLLNQMVVEKTNPIFHDKKSLKSVIIGVMLDRETRRSRITARLKSRLNSGMIEEVEGLLKEGIPSDDLIFYGLEYKYITLYLIGKISMNEMQSQLNIAIHQFSKRQMTWFRKMERDGFDIKWIDGTLPIETKVNNAIKLFSID